MEILIPYQPNVVQQQIHALIEAHRFSILKIHRQAGKTLAAVAEAILAALASDPPFPRAAVVEPQLNMARRNAWDYLRRLAGVVPDVKLNETLLTADFPHNGGRVSLFGADNPDTLRGLHHDYVALDEYALMDPKTWPEVVLPTLAARHGKATLLGTILTRQDPLSLMFEKAASLEGWGRLMLRASETGVLSQEELDAARAVMSAEQYAREFEVEPSSTFDGSVYGAQLDAMEKEGRIGNFPWDPSTPVWTAWDLGVADLTVVWFLQPDGSGWAAIDYEEGTGAGLPFYIKRVRERPYIYGGHIAPFDIETTDYGSGKTRLEVARELGIDFTVAPRLPLEDGLDAVRRFLPRLSIDRTKCARGIESLQGYRFDWSDDLRTFSKRPRHDWASHGCDGLRTFVQGYEDIPTEQEAEAYTRNLRSELQFDPFRYERQSRDSELDFRPWH